MFRMLRKLVLIVQPKFPCKPCTMSAPYKRQIANCKIRKTHITARAYLTFQRTVKRSKFESAIVRITVNWTQKCKYHYHGLSNAHLL